MSAADTDGITLAALELAAAGFPVFPCNAKKQPVVTNGFLSASTDPNIVRTLFSKPGTILIGVPTGPASGVDVLDFDYRHGAGEWEAANQHRLPETRTHQTLNAGRHLLLQHASEVRNSAGRIAPGCDVRGDGGYVIVPPSPGYTVISDAPIAPWPEWLLVPGLALPKLKPSPPISSAVPYVPTSDRRLEAFRLKLLANVRDAPDGQKHERLRDNAKALGGIAARAGFSNEEAVRWLMDALAGKNVADWKLAERTALWGIAAGREEPIELEDRPRSNGATHPFAAGWDDSAHPDDVPPIGEDDLPPTGWRPVAPEKVFEPGRHFRMNQATGVSEVYEPPGALPPPAPEEPTPDYDEDDSGYTGPDAPSGGNSAPHWPQPIDFFTHSNSAIPELSHEHVPEAILDFCIDASQRMGVDPTSVALGCLVSSAAVVTDEWCLQPKRHDDTWTESARLWVAILGPPGTKKTPIIKVCTAPIDNLEIEARKRHQEAMVIYNREIAEWKKAEKKGEQQADMPVRPRCDRYMVEGATIEAIQEVLRDDQEAKFQAPAAKVLCRHDEMGEFFANLDRYNAGGNGGGDRGAYLRLYNGGRYTVDRVTRGSFSTPNWSACFIGGIQPGPIQKIVKSSAEDGLLQRFIYCVPGPQSEEADRKPIISAVKRYTALIPALSQMMPTQDTAGHPQPVVFHEDAHQHRESINALARAMVSLPDTPMRLKAALDKWPGLFARLCLVFHLIEIADARMNNLIGAPIAIVQEQTARRVALLMQDVLLPHLLRADTVMFSSVQTTHAQWIAGHILAGKYERITARDVTRAYQPLRPGNAKANWTALWRLSLHSGGWNRRSLEIR